LKFLVLKKFLRGGLLMKIVSTIIFYLKLVFFIVVLIPRVVQGADVDIAGIATEATVLIDKGIGAIQSKIDVATSLIAELEKGIAGLKDESVIPNKHDRLMRVAVDIKSVFETYLSEHVRREDAFYGKIEYEAVRQAQAAAGAALGDDDDF
jgi:hypothetical protein